MYSNNQNIYSETIPILYKIPMTQVIYVGFAIIPDGFSLEAHF